MKSSSIWNTVNLNLIAKTLSELSFEKVLEPTTKDQKNYKLNLASGARYEFQAWMTIWDFLRVDPQSIRRLDTSTPLSAGQFFIDSQKELGMSDITLGNFLEEMHSTLHSDQKLLQTNQNLGVEELATWSGNEIQNILNGHPKILLNKGRMGFSVSDLDHYSPESCKPFQLRWIALAKKLAITGFHQDWTTETLALESLSTQEMNQFHAVLSNLNQKFEDFILLPVHPWQWDHIIQMQYAEELSHLNLIDLGVAGDFYQPQISLRTLSNISRPEKMDIKLPLSILNTSAVRGISSRYIKPAALISEEVHTLCQQDPFLKQRQTEVLQEKAGVSYQHPLYKQISQSPYRYQETLGAIWRESAQQKIASDEIAILTSSLFHQDLNGHSLIGAYIKNSGLSIEQWLSRYFEVVVIPLYHLQLKYGLGLVAHGQNIVLKLKNYVPQGILLKDFQGDLRVSSESEQLSSLKLNLHKHLDRLPAHYLIHDLLTGHVITVLRFISAVLYESEQFAEKKFYRILSESIQAYHLLFKEPADPRVNLLNPQISRVLLNKVRFRIGYADSSERPLPQLGPDLHNPMSPSFQESL